MNNEEKIDENINDNINNYFNHFVMNNNNLFNDIFNTLNNSDIPIEHLDILIDFQNPNNNSISINNVNVLPNNNTIDNNVINNNSNPSSPINNNVSNNDDSDDEENQIIHNIIDDNNSDDDEENNNEEDDDEENNNEEDDDEENNEEENNNNNPLLNGLPINNLTTFLQGFMNQFLNNGLIINDTSFTFQNNTVNFPDNLKDIATEKANECLRKINDNLDKKIMSDQDFELLQTIYLKEFEFEDINQHTIIKYFIEISYSSLLRKNYTIEETVSYILLFSNLYNLDEYKDYSMDIITNMVIMDHVIIEKQNFIRQYLDSRFQDIKVVLTDDAFDKLNHIDYKNLDEKLKTENVCSICRDNYNDEDNLTLLTCNHFFHKDCAKELLCKFSSKCPNCRLDIDGEKKNI